MSTFRSVAAAGPSARPGRTGDSPSGAQSSGAPRTRAARGAIAVGLATAAVSAAGVWLTWRVFVATAPGQRVDQAVFDGALYGRTHLWRVAQPILDVVSVPYIAVVLIGAVLIAALRRRWGLAVQVALLMGGANLTTQVLKHWGFDRPDFGLGAGATNTLPSGHTTAAASVSAALVFVVPPRARPWAAVLGAVYTATTGVSTLIGRWHRPSDVIAAVLVVLAWSGLACALAAGTGPRAGDGSAATPTAEFARPRLTRTGPIGIGGGILLLVALLAALPAGYALHRLWTTPGLLEARSELLVAYAGGAFGVVSMSALAFAALLAVRHLAGRAT